MRTKISVIFFSIGISLCVLHYVYIYLHEINYRLEISSEMLKRYANEVKTIEGIPTIRRSSIVYPKEKQQYAYIQSENKDVQEKIYYGDSEDILDIGVGQYMGSGIFAEGRPILLAGHNGTNFKGLQYIKDKEKLYVTTDYGSFVYRVYQMEVKKASEFDESILKKDEEILIMYTCYPFSALTTEYRYFIYAQKIEGVQIEEDVR